VVVSGKRPFAPNKEKKERIPKKGKEPKAVRKDERIKKSTSVDAVLQ